jgi:hypothetical protein
MANKQISNLYQAQSNSIASYDYVDIAAGAGYVIFDGFAATTSTATTYHLSSDAIISDPRSFAMANETSDTTLTFNTSPFNKPQTIKGDIMVTCTTTAKYVANNPSLYVVVTAYHYDGTTATSLGTATSPTTTAAGGTTSDTRVLFISSVNQRFKKGEIFRVTVRCVYTEGDGNSQGEFCHDPANRDGLYTTAASNPTYFKVAVPFRLDEIGL